MFGQISKDKSERKIRILIFLFSLLFHLVFIDLAVLFFRPIKLFPRQKILNVVIASPEDLFIPGVEEEPRRRQDSGEFLPAGKVERGGEIPAESKKIEKEETGGESAGGEQAGLPFNPGLASGFRLRQPIEGGQGTIGGRPVNFSLRPSQIEPSFGEKGKSAERRELSLAKYIFPGTSRGRLAGTSRSSSSYGWGGSPRGGGGSSPLKNYDIGPWAENVINQIQANWTLPSAQQSTDNGVVKISVVVGKNGEVMFSEIASSSGMDWFDQAALNAVQRSSPFPKLPDDFPLESFEVVLVFQCDD
jgi:TonB family protein